MQRPGRLSNTYSCCDCRWRSRYQLGETPQVLSNRRKSKLILGAARPTQTQSRETQDAFQVRKQHLDTFAIALGLLESLGLGQGTSNVAGTLVHIAHDPTRGHVRTAFWFERARAAVRQGRLVTNRVIRTNMAGGRQRFSSRAYINVLFLVEPEVLP
jgi:hypothetical protein